MQYVGFGKTGLKVSRFGLGCMRFPSDENKAIEMVRYALAHGVNYIDTAYAYGKSESIVGKAFENGYREKAILATKNPVWEISSHADFEKILDEELKRLNADYIDVYLLHDLNTKHWEYVQKYDGLTFIDKMVEKGKIKHKACSFHGPYDHFVTVVDSFDWEMVQIQLGILDDTFQAGVKGLKYASQKGLPVVVMEPLRGGALSDYVPDEVTKLVNEYSEKRSLIEWAFRWLYDMPEVTTVLSGTGTLEQLKENIAIFDKADFNVLSEQDREFISSIKDAFRKKYAVPCTGCEYCMPCPSGVNIPEIFNFYNLKKMTHHWVDGLLYQRNNILNKTDAGQCTECGECLEKCPQEIDIPARLKEAHAALT